MVVPAEWGIQRIKDFLGHKSRIFSTGNFRKKNHKFISSGPRNRIASSQTFLEAIRYGLQAGITKVMSECIIDEFQIVDTEENDCHGFVMPAGKSERLCQAVIE